MSEYSKLEAQYKDKECLLEALAEMGYASEQVEQHEIAAQMYDYHGHATHYVNADGDKANLIIRRQNVQNANGGRGSATNDLGFVKEGNGMYAPIVSDYDSHKHCSKWMVDLKVKYQVAVNKKEAKRQRFVQKSSKIEGRKLVIRYLQP